MAASVKRSGEGRMGDVSETEDFARVVYRPMTAVITGGLVLVMAAFLLFDTVRRGSGAAAWALGAGLVLGSLIVYISSIRPAVVAESRRLIVRNPLCDITVPWASVTDLRLRYQLEVLTSGDTYHAWAVPVTTRSRSDALLRRRERADVTAWMGPSAGEYAVTSGRQPFARQILDELSLMSTQRRSNSVGEPEVRWSWPFIAAIATSAVALAVALAVR
jgi:hypothetical protein